MQFDLIAGNENSSLLFEISPNHKSVINRYDIFYIIVISLFAHIGYNPIEQQNILTTIIILGKQKKYIITALQVKKSCGITLHTIHNGVN